MFSEKFITIEDIYIAYRKAKQEAFFDSFHSSSILYAEFEKRLKANITKLHNIIITNNSKWWEDINFLGGYRYVPKSIDDSLWDNKDSVHYRSVDPMVDWMQKFKENNKLKINAQFRLIICATVEYQIISALWILKVGHKFDERLSENFSYGNRLRRNGSEYDADNRTPNQSATGLFSPYFSAYKNWRDNGLEAMRSLVTENKVVTAITMDLTSFYHNIGVKFILRPSFLKKIGLTLDDNEFKFTQQLIDSIDIWYSNTPDFKERPEGGIPVGLSASKVISNVLLYELDDEITKNINPRYYGRYVDDIFLVFETPENTLSGDEILKFLSKKIECLKISRKKDCPPNINLRFNYATDSELKFTANKQRIFSLSSEHGLDLINQISSQIRLQSSEYRMLPSLPRKSVQMAEKALLASSDASLTADALRKADAISIRRLGLSLLIRDIESYSQDLARSDWYQVRQEFYGLVDRYLLTPKGVFELFGYYKRIFQLMIANYDFEYIMKFIDKLKNSLDIISNTVKFGRNGRDKFELCKEYFSKSLGEIAFKASTCKDFNKWEQLHDVLCHLNVLSERSMRFNSVKDIKILSRKLLISDLGTRPYKDYWYYAQAEDANGISIPKKTSIKKALRISLIYKFVKKTNLKFPHWPALAFATRPLTIQEIVLLCPCVLSDNRLLKDSIMGLRGAKVINNNPLGYSDNINGMQYLNVPSDKKNKINIALTSFETTTETYDMVVKGDPDRSLDRYERVNGLINNILRSEKRSDYIVFPECSLPRRWAINISGKLGKQGVSLISGLEYYKGNKTSELRNDSLISLSTNWPGYSSNFLVMQPKMNPSHEEISNLKSVNKSLYVPDAQQERPPIYRHGDYFFGVLICSDLTNPLNRFRFQGKIDTLFVLEWNADVNTFSYLVEGAAHDIHTFIVQVNNRTYGDSRVRTPYRASYKRDLVRLKGGVDDYFVIAEIDYLPLRDFQCNGDMTSKTSDYKPVPIGFLMSGDRA